MREKEEEKEREGEGGSKKYKKQFKREVTNLHIIQFHEIHHHINTFTSHMNIDR